VPLKALAETMARTLGFAVYELRVCMEQGRVGEALLEVQPNIATDNGQ